jgi:predicted amidohydrolase
VREAPVRVACVQLDIVWEDPEASCARVEPLARTAAAAGARLLVLPEMFATGFSMDAERVAGHASGIATFTAKLARRLGVWVAAGWAEPGPIRPANTCRLVDPDGVERLVYRKIHPFSLAGEPDRYVAGDEVVTIAVEGVRVTPFVCYDLRFPELFRLAADATDLFLVPANWPDRRRHAWSSLLVARALDAQAWVAGVNRVGVDGHGVAHSGDSAVVSPLGEVVAMRSETEGVVTADVDPDEVVRVRRRYGFLDDRRPELYRRLDDARRME